MKESARSSTADNHSEPKIFRGARHYVCQTRKSDGGHSLPSRPAAEWCGQPRRTRNHIAAHSEPARIQ